MKQEEKDLLLKDLSARLPYGVKCEYHHIQYVENGKMIDIKMYGIVNIDGHIKDICDVKPYLLPLSSMTEEQKREYIELLQIGPATGSARGYISRSNLRELTSGNRN